jgi:phage shock protein PspC (stress-responsive transcriptional regulator)
MVKRGALAQALTMSTQATTPIPEPPVTRRLTRSSSDRVIAGVAGGLGRYIGVDAVVVRLAMIVLAFFGGVGLVAYIAAWLIVPSDDGSTEGFDAAGLARRTGVALGVLVLTCVAAVGGFWGFASGGATATAIVVIAIGSLLAIGAFTGGMRWLILPAIALALSAGGVAAANVDIRGGTGERIYHPVSTQSLRSEYRLGIGHLRVDLRDAKLTPGDHRIHLKLGVGQAEVLVPAGVCVSSTAHVAAGATTVFDRSTGGADHDWQDLRTAPAGTPHLIVDGDVGFGELRIEPGPEGVTGTNGACTNG